MRSPGEPRQLNQRSFGCMIELAVIMLRHATGYALTVLPRTSRRQLSPVVTSSAPLRHCYCGGTLSFRTSLGLDSELPGMTVLTFNEGGLIETVRLYHRPYHQVIDFADELASRLSG